MWKKIKYYYELVKILFKLKDINMKNWKTTLGGILISLGTLLNNIPDPFWVAYIGQALILIGGLLLGITAQDATKGKTTNDSN